MCRCSLEQKLMKMDYRHMSVCMWFLTLLAFAWQLQGKSDWSESMYIYISKYIQRHSLFKLWTHGGGMRGIQPTNGESGTKNTEEITEYDEQMLIENMSRIDDMLALISFAQSAYIMCTRLAMKVGWIFTELNDKAAQIIPFSWQSNQRQNRFCGFFLHKNKSIDFF